MKKLFVLLLVLSLLCVSAIAESIDISGLSYDELVALKDRINKAIWESEEWQEVTVPIGVWKIGEDIPVGHWTITAAPGGDWGSVEIGNALEETGKSIDIIGSDYYWGAQVKEKGSSASVDMDEIDYDFKDGDYIVIEYSDMVFTPYAGKASLGFK